MTLIAGILKRRKGVKVSPSDCEELRNAISRKRDDAVTIFEDESIFMAKVDVGAYGHPAFKVSPRGSVSMLAGEPLMSRDASRVEKGRDADLGLLHQCWDQGNWTVLSKTNGVFCAAHYVPTSSALTLIADKLGIRPLYYWIDGEQVVFASALRILEALSFLPKSIDLRGVTEMVGLGYALEKRTPYAGVKLLAAGEFLTFSGASVSSQRYWNWDSASIQDSSEEERMELLHQHFKNAVEERLRGDVVTVSFLSGGLDSRCIVAALREQGTTVYTFNFGFPGAQDQLFAATFSRISGTVHFERGMPAGDARWSMMLSDEWNAVQGRISQLPEHPQLVWSGDGGSVGLGHVYLTRRVVDLMREGKVDAAINSFLADQRMAVPTRLFRPHIATRLRPLLLAGIREELESIQCQDRGRAFHLFLMLNDQRRHLSNHFEDIDLHRLEFHLPFFDSQFLSTVMTFPVDESLNHGTYAKWLKSWPTFVTAVPWQTYPGHIPCSLPVPKNAAYQWSESKLYRANRRARKQTLIRETCKLLVSRTFPTSIMKRSALCTAAFLCWLGIGDYGYVLNAAGIYSRFWSADGNTLDNGTVGH
jgi:asparagine synthase (glutamine-hydrolysing)